MSTTGRLGADPDQLEHLAARMGQAAESLVGIADTVRSHLHSTGWSGRDGDQFRLEWYHTHTPRLAVVATLLWESSQALRAQADQQRAASAGDPGTRGVLMAVHGTAATALSGINTVTLSAGANGPSALDTANVAASAGLDIASEILRIRYYGAIGLGFSGLLTIFDVVEGVRNGWGDEQIGQVSLGVVGIGVGAAAFFCGPVGWAAVGIGAGISVLSTVPVVNQAVGGVVRGAGEFLYGVGSAGASFIDDAADAIGGALEPVGEAISVTTDAIGSAVGDFASGAMDTARGFASKLNPFD